MFKKSGNSTLRAEDPLSDRSESSLAEAQRHRRAPATLLQMCRRRPCPSLRSRQCPHELGHLWGAAYNGFLVGSLAITSCQLKISAESRLLGAHVSARKETHVLFIAA
jgi:hypothetical protein